jgi:hypothetical protein
MYVCMCMYVCMYVCKWVYVSECMYVCMYVALWIYGNVLNWIPLGNEEMKEEWIREWIREWKWRVKWRKKSIEGNRREWAGEWMEWSSGSVEERKRMKGRYWEERKRKYWERMRYVIRCRCSEESHIWREGERGIENEWMEMEMNW